MCSIMGCTTKKLTKDQFMEGFQRTKSRGPDMSRTEETPSGRLGFHRLSIMDMSVKGMQPFRDGESCVICNGELYGWRTVKEELGKKGYEFKGDSDCEIILPMYREYGVDMFEKLDAEFAMVIYDGGTDSWIAARDPIGIRPLYYGRTEDGGFVFASEPKNMVGLVQYIEPFPPGYYFKDGAFVKYMDVTDVKEVSHDSVDVICRKIHDKLTAGIAKGWMQMRLLDSFSAADWTVRSCARWRRN